jgi:hypothetical protein
MRSPLSRAFVIGFCGALVAVVIAGLAYHGYRDHAALHDMQQFLQMYAARIAKLP